VALFALSACCFGEDCQLCSVGKQLVWLASMHCMQIEAYFLG
jgi:hypothetical protein